MSVKSHRLAVKALIAVLLLLLVASCKRSTASQDASAQPEVKNVTLTIASWRIDDTRAMRNVLDAFEKENPGIKVEFKPTNPPDYNAQLNLQLSNGSAADIIYSRSFATGQAIYDQGHFLKLNGEAFLNNYNDGEKAAWRTPSGDQFAMPLSAVSHGIYYNKSLFEQLGISVPQTWEELMAAAQKIKDSGVTPFANGIADEWDINEVVFQPIVSNFIGGTEGRMKLEAGTMKFDGPEMTAAFQAIADLKPFVPSSYEAVSYSDAKSLLLLGKAAMMFNGSWDIKEIEGDQPDFEWSVFAVPPPASNNGKAYIVFHPDTALAINSKSAHIPEAKKYLAWMSTPAASKLLADQVPGFFPMVKSPIKLDNQYANAFLALNQGRTTDVRFTWPHLMDGNPSGYNLVTENVIKVLKGEESPSQASKAFREGLATWYDPAK